MFAAKNEFFTPSQGYQISRSVRLRSSASAYFNRTNASSPTNAIKWTWSGWVKRGSLGAQQNLVGATNSGSDDTYFNFNSSDQIVLGSYTGAGTDYGIKTSAVFRDPCAWYHVVAVLDTANATSADRAIIYVNGVRQTVTNSANGMWPQNATNNKINTASQVVNIGRRSLGDSYLDGYLTEINFIDGQALTPTSFGQFNSVTGVWQPLKYTGTYGTNGFYLNFSDNSAATATTIGKDYSGNGNNWTPNNISVTSGTTYDSMLDVPTMWADGGNGRGNYAVFNPLDALKSSSASVSNGNLTASPGTTGKRGPMGTLGVSSGKWYFEVVETNRFSDGFIGVCSVSTTSTDYPGASSDSWSYYGGNGNKYNGGTATSYGSSYVDNDVIGVAVDMDNGKIWFSKNGTWQASGDPSAGTNAAYTNLSGYTVTAVVGDDSTTTGGAPTFNANFGQRPFSQTVPTGFKALNTQNLPSPTISNGALYMAATTYTGNGATGQSVVNSGNNTAAISFKPDFVWVKVRSTAGTDHYLADSVRGATKYLQSDTTAAEGTNNGITAFNSNGFSVGAVGDTNTNGATIVGWQWQAGQGTTSSNTSGSITSTVSVNATAGFSIVSFNSGTAGNKTVGHGLGVAPSLIITKNRDGVASWAVWSSSFSNTAQGYLLLNGTGAVTNDSRQWANTAPTSTVFSFETGYSFSGNSNIIAYCFSAVAGYSAFGKYTSNQNSDGPFVYLGFRPRFLMIKRTDSAQEWVIVDTGRSTYNQTAASLLPNSSGSEGTGNNMDILSNGFKIRTSGDGINFGVGGTYIYACFAENPFKLALAR